MIGSVHGGSKFSELLIALHLSPNMVDPWFLRGKRKELSNDPWGCLRAKAENQPTTWRRSLLRGGVLRL